MITTLNIDEKLIRRTAELTGPHKKTHLVRLSLQALIARESSKRLAKLGESERKLKTEPRRKGPGKKQFSLTLRYE
jgi:hypothetical protein